MISGKHQRKFSLLLWLNVHEPLSPVHTDRHKVMLTGGTFGLFDGNCDGQNGWHTHLPFNIAFDGYVDMMESLSVNRPLLRLDIMCLTTNVFITVSHIRQIFRFFHLRYNVFLLLGFCLWRLWNWLSVERAKFCWIIILGQFPRRQNDQFNGGTRSDWVRFLMK